MRRLGFHVAVALLTFTIGVFAASIWVNWFSHFTVTRPESVTSHQPLKNGNCEEWERAETVDRGFGWDLTYQSLFSSNGVSPESPFFKWATTTKPQPPLKELLSTWRDDPIISAILIEMPPVCVGSWGGQWLIRTKSNAYLWGFSDGKLNLRDKKLISVQDYDKAFVAMACWSQEPPTDRDGITEGYMGFLSLYREGKSRQMLLTVSDFVSGNPWDSGNISGDRNNRGRVLTTLLPIWSSTAQSNNSFNRSAN